MNNVILDANFLVAIIDTRDKWRNSALEIFDLLKKRGLEGLIFDCVANEVVSVIGKRCEEKHREEEYDAIMRKASSYITEENLVRVYPMLGEMYNGVLELVSTHRRMLNFHDALIALAAERMGINDIVSFDKDFDEIEWLRRIKSPEDL
jgi:predicted nucleic acid-binding protein